MWQRRHTVRATDTPLSIGLLGVAAMAWCGVVHGMAWYGMVWYGMVWYGMVWYGIVTWAWYRYGMASVGAQARALLAWVHCSGSVMKSAHATLGHATRCVRHCLQHMFSSVQHTRGQRRSQLVAFDNHFRTAHRHRSAAAHGQLQRPVPVYSTSVLGWPIAMVHAARAARTPGCKQCVD